MSPPAAVPLTGRCLCGRIRYCCGPPLYPPTLCHCESCRRAAGAHVVAWLTSTAGAYAVTAGRPVEFRSSAAVRRTFCGACGTPLTYQHERRANEVDVTVATLDAPGGVVPVDHIWMSDALAWDRPADGLPQHPATRVSG